MNVAFQADGESLVVNDPIERRQYALATTDPVTPEAADPATLAYPVDAAVRVRTAGLTLPTVVPIYVREPDGEMLAEVDHFSAETFPEGRYTLELPTPIKLYLAVESAVSVSADAERTRIEFEDGASVVVGARSHHTRPAGTVTTTEDPSDVMAAVSSFGSALKTTSPERSYPSLRGHPPTVELGDELSIPDGLDTPDTGVTIEVPADYRHAYVAAPLAFYLGADVVPGDEPRLVTDRGFEYDLASGDGFEREVERVLKQVFFLDCITRTEGITPVDLHERDVLESRVDLDFGDLYDRPLASQVAAYLAVPHGSIGDQLPEWKLTTHVAPGPETAELLPFVLDDLAVVRTRGVRTATSPDEQVSAVNSFLRGSGTRSASADGATFVEPSETASVEQAWFGDGTPLGATKATRTAFRNRLDRTPVEGDIDVTVVCNDEEMRREIETIDGVYGSRSTVPLSVTAEYGLTTDELAGVLTSEVDFLHFIGHIDDGGFRCTDGRLDAGTLDAVGVDAFLLNACRSYDQGLSLVRNGSIGGVVTLSEVVNVGATRIGELLARLLNGGFPLRPALEVARDQSAIGGKYVVVGDGGISVAQPESGTPTLCELERTDGSFEMTVRAFVTDQEGMGSLFMPFVESNEEYYLNSGKVGTFTLDEDELRQFLELENVPVKVGGKLLWSSDVELEEV